MDMDFSEKSTVQLPLSSQILGTTEHSRPTSPVTHRLWYAGEVLEGLYRIEGVLAQGGMGVVYRATDLAANRLVVIKSMLPKLSGQDEYKWRFIRESEAWIDIGVYPHVVRAFTVLHINFLPHLVLEFIDGHSLYEIMSTGKLLSIDQVLDYGIQICWGMAHAHKSGHIHRDIKPANILVSKSGVVKITDFGLVKPMSEADGIATATLSEENVHSSVLLMTQGALGTPEYMAPEQWRGEADRRSDIFSFGLVLFQLLAGRLPVQVDRIKNPDWFRACRLAYVGTPSPDITTMRDDIPEGLGPLLQTCLHEDKEQRPQDFDELACALQSIAAATGNQPRRQAPQPEEIDKAGQLDQAYAYYRLGIRCLAHGDIVKSRELLDRGHVVFQKYDDAVGILLFYRGVASIYNSTGQFKKLIEFTQDKIHLVKQQSDPELLIRFIGLIVWAYLNLGQSDEAHVLADSIEVDVMEADRDDIWMFWYQLRGTISIHEKKFEESCEYIEKGLSYAARLENEHHVLVLHGSLGWAHYNQGHIELARKHYEIGLKIAEDVGVTHLSCQMRQNLGDVHRDFREFEKAESMYRSSLKVSEKFQFNRITSQTLLEMARLFVLQGKYPAAQDHLKRSIVLKKKIGDLREQEAITLLKDVESNMNS